MRFNLVVAVGLLSLSACRDDFTIDEADASADAGTDASRDAANADADVAEDATNDAGVMDSAAPDAVMADVMGDVINNDDGSVDPVCAPPWLYYVVRSDDEPTYVARYSIAEDGTERCADLTGGDAIADLTSSALVVNAESMILAGPESLQQLNLVTDRIEWTLSPDLDFTALGPTSLFYVGATSFGVGWDQDTPSMGGVSIRNVESGAIQRELDVMWQDATAAPEQPGDLWILGRSRLGRNVAQRYVVGSQSAIEEIELQGTRISTVDERLVIATSATYRLYDLDAEGPTFVDTVFLPSDECRLVDVVGHPFRDEVFVGCGSDGNIESVRIHNRDTDSYEAVPNSVQFDESVSSLSLYEGP